MSRRNLHVAGCWTSRCRTTVISQPEPQSCASCKISCERYADRTTPNSACVRRCSMMNAAIRVTRRSADATTHLTAVLRAWLRRITNWTTTRTKAFPRNAATTSFARLCSVFHAFVETAYFFNFPNRKTVSLPFQPGEYRRIGVKVIDDRGIESLNIAEVK